MLRLPDFEFEKPESVEEAAALLDEHGTDAMPVAGGTDVYPKMKRRQFTPDVLVSLQDVEEMTGVREADDGGLVVGSRATLADVAGHERVQAEYPGVAEAVEAVATPHHRRMGTIGGNLCQDTRCYYYDQNQGWRESLGWCRKAPDADGWPPDEESIDEVPCRTVPGSGRCWATFASDSAPALIAYEAEVELVGSGGKRTLPLADFYTDDGIAPYEMDEDELITQVRLPPADGVDSTYLKLSQRDSFDFPSLGVAAAAKQADDGTVEHARLVLGAVSTHPLVIEEAPDLLEGEQPDEDLLEEVGQAASRAARPMDNDDMPPAHRNQMASVYTERAFEELLEIA